MTKTISTSRCYKKKKQNKQNNKQQTKKNLQEVSRYCDVFVNKFKIALNLGTVCVSDMPRVLRKCHWSQKLYPLTSAIQQTNKKKKFVIVSAIVITQNLSMVSNVTGPKSYWSKTSLV